MTMGAAGEGNGSGVVIRHVANAVVLRCRAWKQAVILQSAQCFVVARRRVRGEFSPSKSAPFPLRLLYR